MPLEQWAWNETTGFTATTTPCFLLPPDVQLTQWGYRLERDGSEACALAYDLWACRTTPAPHPRYCLLLEMPEGTLQLIWIATFPDLLAWLARYAQPSHLAQVQETLDTLLLLWHQAFRAQHGHDAFGMPASDTRGVS